MSERLWSYAELKCVKLNEMGCSSEELAIILNQKFHDGGGVRTAKDVDKIKSTNTIFTRKKEKR